MKNIISNNSKNVKCPICHSYDIYKFGKDPKTGNQKYQCKHCKHQGTFLNPVNNRFKKIILSVLFVAVPLIYIMITNSIQITLVENVNILFLLLNLIALMMFLHLLY